MSTREPAALRAFFFHAHGEECDPVCVLESLGKPAALQTALLDSADFRDQHEHAIRDHILGAGKRDHTCDDLCSDAIVDRLLGMSPLHEYPLQPQYAAAASPAETPFTTWDEKMSAVRSHAFPVCEVCGTYADDPEAWETCSGPPSLREGGA